uniref:RNA-directed RNA polymerase C-terminal domain-containing protein n=1 Tax=Riboviria sp. TaxID=2585031 RepID=A0A8K1U4D3_9VIRU|nr:MAG: hypothetical protein 1 [Riboviria sp.]
MDRKMTSFVFGRMMRLQDFDWALPNDFLSFSHYKRVIDSLDWTSSPGTPYNQRYSNNGQMFGVRDGIPSVSIVEEIWQHIQYRLHHRTCDPIYLFVKPEPLPERKQGRPRLISSVSVIDQIIDHMLFDAFNQRIIDQASMSPIKVGWTPMLGGWKTIPRKGISIDKSSWDWTMAHWIFDAILKFKASNCTSSGEAFIQWRDLAAWRYRCLFNNPEFCLPNGFIFRQKNLGVMKSGSVVTITDNSLAQLIIHFRTYFELGWVEEVPEYIWVCGDDTRQSRPKHLRMYLEYLSGFCKVKDWTERCEFVGCRFLQDGRVEPLYKGKHAFTILHADPAVETDLAYSYSLLYHKSIDRDNVRNMLLTYGPPMTLDFADEIWNGE